MDKKRPINGKYAHITDVGCVRELNEDSLYVSDRLWLVADGMGGHACGEVASQLASQVISREFSRNGVLSDAIQAAHHKVVQAGQEGVGQSGMGTTVVAMCSDGNDYEIDWVGDSRAYLWEAKKKRITQLTEDHSLIVRLINSGLITQEDAKSHPQRHMITQCLGSVEIESVKVDGLRGQWQPDQSILLCSDGLSDDVSESELASLMALPVSRQQKLEKMVEAAKSYGGKDNISIVIVDSPIESEPTWLERLVGFFRK